MPDVQQLLQRLRAEFDAARHRVEALRVEALDAFHQKRQRYEQFAAASQHIGGLLEPHIDAFRNFFQGVHEQIDILHLGTGGREVHGAFVTFSFPHTKDCPASITLKFTLGHDADIHNIVLEYDLALVPVYLQFEKHDTLTIPLDRVDDEAITAWFDEKLTRFAALYLSLPFIPQYQQEGLVPDRVLGLSFPRLFAAGQVEHDGTTYYFYTEDSLREFQADPARYLAAPARESPPGSHPARSGPAGA